MQREPVVFKKHLIYTRFLGVLAPAAWAGRAEIWGAASPFEG